jgi:hypothetical protein
MLLKDLLSLLTRDSHNRVPVVDEGGQARYIIHRSMIEQFIVHHTFSGEGGKAAAELTLGDLLSDEKMERMFSSTFLVVDERTSLAEAKAAMLRTENCLDVFVTKGGRRESPVIGWLTNHQIAEGSQPR